MKLVITIGLLLLIPTSFAEIYRWVDNDGKLHFSDQPPEDSTVSEEVSSKMSPINRDSSAEEIEKLQQVFQGETPEEQAFHQQQKAQQQRREQSAERACQQAQYNLQVLRGRVYFEDPDGNEIIVTEEQREQRANQLAEKIRRHCT
ncbi:MAG TPA: DUF4124 domain-containing protein [Porticoccus sp.]|nr:DUF4124 domain-containing protein [Porticoccus sp.]